jgi:hypothetical protein
MARTLDWRDAGCTLRRNHLFSDDFDEPLKILGV